MRENKVIQAVAAAVILGALGALAIGGGGFGPDINPGPPRAAGAELARQALSVLKPGGHIMIFTRDTATFKNPASDILLESFQRELRQAHASISTVQALQVDPLRPIQVPSGDFQECIHSAADGDVIVSFMGPPALTMGEITRLGEVHPNIVAFCPGNCPNLTDFHALFEHGLLHAAIVTRYDQTPAPGKPRNQQEWFDQNFMVVTAANVDDFTAAAKKLSAVTSP